MSNDHRDDWYSARLLDTNLRVIRNRLDISPGGTVTRKLDAAVRGTGDLEITLDDVAEIPWEQSYIRILHHTTNRAETELPIFTGLPSVGDESYLDGRVSIKVTICDPVSVLEDEPIGVAYGCPAGANVIEEVQEVINTAGIGQLSLLAPSDQVLSASIVWTESDNKLKVVNDLLKAAGHQELWADGHGRLRSDPYLDPTQRAISWQFADDSSSFIVPDWTRKTDRYHIPNRIRCIQLTEGSQPADIAIATNQDPTSPWSYQNRGNRWITKTIKDVAAVTFDELASQAKQELAKATLGAGEFDISHPVLGFFENEIVNLTHSRLTGSTRRLLCTSQRYRLQTGAMIQSSFKEVYTYA